MSSLVRGVQAHQDGAAAAAGQGLALVQAEDQELALGRQQGQLRGAVEQWYRAQHLVALFQGDELLAGALAADHVGQLGGKAVAAAGGQQPTRRSWW
ncbi:hypothetical protein G6F68_017590 [Rhizopus microsporus]|nr:hypothetical protein G6F68_017590 [Rhizopus microsporus]